MINIYKWEGIPADVSLTTISEGIRQLKSKHEVKNLFCAVHPDNKWVLDVHRFAAASGASFQKELFEIPFMLQSCIHKWGFILVCDHAIFFGPDTI